MDGLPRLAARPALVLAWLAAALTFAAWAAAAVLASRTEGIVEAKPITLAVVWLVPGVLIAAGRPRIAIGWLILAVAFLFACSALANQWLGHAESVGDPAGVAWALWTVDRFSAFLVPCSLLALALLPDGKLPSAVWRPLMAVVLGAQIMLVTAWCLVDGPAGAPDSEFRADLGDVANPLGLLPAGFGELLDGLDLVVLQVPLLMCLVAFVVRLRRSEERARIGSVLFAAAVFVLAVVVGRALWPVAADLLDIAGSGLLVAVLTAAVLRRRLRELDVVVSYAFAYGVLTVLIAGVYVATASFASQLGHDFSLFGAGIVAAITALALHPLRNVLQRLVDSVMYGDRGDPVEALRRLADRVHDAPTLDDVLAGLASSIATSLRADWVEARLDDHGAATGVRPVAATGATAPLAVPAPHHGSITVAMRPGRRIRADERGMLAELARHGSIAVRAVVLAETVKASRLLLVQAREEERMRIRRDLHDELGPTLAGLSMQLKGLGAIIRRDPEVALERLVRLERAATEALDNVRRVARELRPPLLDELGLGPALAQVGADLGVEVEVSDRLRHALTPAVEVAAYRIGSEALTNVARHAGVSRARLDLSSAAGSFRLEVSDDGCGVASAPRGIGMSSMRERAEEIEGVLDIHVGPRGGTAVVAEIPVTETREVDA